MTLDPLKLEIMVVSHTMFAGNWTWVLCRSGKCSYLLSHLYSHLPPLFFFLKCYLNDVVESGHSDHPSRQWGCWETSHSFFPGGTGEGYF